MSMLEIPGFANGVGVFFEGATRAVSAMVVGSCGPGDRAYAGVGGCASGRLAAWSLMEGVVWDYKALCDEPGLCASC